MRSLLMVKPDGDDSIAAAAEAGANGLVIDVAGASAGELDRVSRHLGGRRRAPVYLRVSPIRSGQTAGELDAIVPMAPDGIVLPEASGETSVERLSALLRPREAIAGLADRSIRVIALCADAPDALTGIAGWRERTSRLAGLACDPTRLAAILGVEPSAAPVQLARSLTVLAAAAAGVPAFDGPSAEDDFAAGVEAALRDGFAGKFAVNADQARLINRAFSRRASSR